MSLDPIRKHSAVSTIPFDRISEFNIDKVIDPATAET